jgi:glutamate synthase (NADPH/NADH) small chain
MTDLWAFLRRPRVAPPKQTPVRRLRHWHEYERVADDAGCRAQAERCMECAIPWCHSHCPVHNLIPDWNALVTDGDWRTAWEQLESTNNFPELTGRLCPAPCEDACTLRLADAPVTIRAIELAIAERAFAAGWVQPQPPAATDDGGNERRRRQVAVVGSGPAGLACAQQLARAGYRVTVYERDARPGGLLRYGIPDFRLEKGVIDRRVAQMQAEGVRFRTGVAVGTDLDAEALRRSVDALVLANGCTEPRDVAPPGRALGGIHFALDYLTQQNRRLGGEAVPAAGRIDAHGRDVVVIGGGDTGGDCVGTAIRQGARSVVQIQYHAAPPHRGDVLRHWPRPVPELEPNDHDAEGNRRLWGWETVGFEGQEGRVAGVRLQRLCWRTGDDGRPRRQPVAGQDRTLPAQLVLIAIGYCHPEHAGALAELRPALTGRGLIAADDHDYRTSRAKVFACGDARRGQSLIVWAIREGRQCAAAVDRWLAGGTDLPWV